MRLSCLLAISLFLSSPWLHAQTTIHVPADQPTIQAGINAANNGDIVLVAPGTYVENIDFKGKAITVTSGATSYAGAATTIIDGSATAAVVTFKTNEGRSSIINGFTIRNGFALPVPTNALTSTSAGGIDLLSAGPSITNNLITDNQGCGIGAILDTALIQGNDIKNTTTIAPAGPCNLDGNGAGISLFESRAEIIGNVIENNNNSNYCGAIVSVFTYQLLLQNNIIRNNKAACTAAASLLMGGPLTMVQNLIYGNTVTTPSGSPYNDPGVYIENAIPFTGLSFGLNIVNNTFYGNIETVPNVATAGEQLYIEGPFGPSTIENNLFISSSSYSAVACNQPTANLNFRNNDVFNETGAVVANNCAVSVASVAVDPLFANPSAGNFHLQPGSSVEILGDISAPGLPSTDLDGNPRISNGFTALGVYESTGSALPPTASVLTSAPNPATAGQAVLFTATINASGGTPTGTVTFLDRTTVLGTTAITSGTAAFTSSTLSPGTHNITCTYSGNANFASSTCNTVVQVVNGILTSASLTANPNPSPASGTVSLNAIVTSAPGSPTGTVMFYDGTTVLDTATLSNGVATFAASGLAPGTHNITCTYSGSTIYSPSNCNTVPVRITSATNAPTFTLTAAQNPFDVPFNTSTTDSLILTSLNGFSGTITVSCPAVPPTGNTCSLSSPTVALASNGTATTTLSVTNTSVSTTTGTGFWGISSMRRPTATPSRTLHLAFAAFFPLSLLTCFGLARRKRLAVLRSGLMLVCLAILASAVTGCGTGETFITLGSHDMLFTATGTSAGTTTPVTQTLHITLVITP